MKKSDTIYLAPDTFPVIMNSRYSIQNKLFEPLILTIIFPIGTDFHMQEGRNNSALYDWLFDFQLRF
jgi:hypothetical protein